VKQKTFRNIKQELSETDSRMDSRIVHETRLLALEIHDASGSIVPFPLITLIFFLLINWHVESSIKNGGAPIVSKNIGHAFGSFSYPN
jgi:hypothetical protein